MVKDKKKVILMFLNKEGRSSTSRIASFIKSDTFRTKIYLEQLLKLKKVVREEESRATYWSLKNV